MRRRRDFPILKAGSIACSQQRMRLRPPKCAALSCALYCPNALLNCARFKAEPLRVGSTCGSKLAVHPEAPYPVRCEASALTADKDDVHPRRLRAPHRRASPKAPLLRARVQGPASADRRLAPRPDGRQPVELRRRRTRRADRAGRFVHEEAASTQRSDTPPTARRRKEKEPPPTLAADNGPQTFPRRAASLPAASARPCLPPPSGNGKGICPAGLAPKHGATPKWRDETTSGRRRAAWQGITPPPPARRSAGDQGTAPTRPAARRPAADAGDALRRFDDPAGRQPPQQRNL